MVCHWERAVCESLVLNFMISNFGFFHAALHRVSGVLVVFPIRQNLFINQDD